jgi:hypothetical protein
MRKIIAVMGIFLIVSYGLVFATPSTLIWSPSTDIQPYGKIHAGADFYFPTKSKYTNADNYDQHNYIQQVYGLTFSLLSDKPEKNLLGKVWKPLGMIMAETGFDYKRGFGSYLDSTPWYFNFKFGTPENAYFKYMPALAAGCYDMGTRANRTNYDIGYFRVAETVNIGKFSLGRFSAGYFRGNGRLLRDKNGLRDNGGPLIGWERTMTEISDKLWVCVDYQGTQSLYGALNLGFSWRFNKYFAAILGYDIYNNRNLSDTVTLQLDFDF